MVTRDAGAFSRTRARAALACAVIAAVIGGASCSPASSAPLTVRDGAPDTGASTEEAVDGGARAGEAAESEPTTKSARAVAPSADDLVTYLEANVPSGGTVTRSDPPKILHKVAPGEDATKLAQLYLPLTEVYYQRDLERMLGSKNLTPGATVEIPQVLTRPIRDPKEERLGWPEDQALRGVFVTGSYASIKWPEVLDKLAERGLNAVVLDGKDYDGYVNYPSKAKIALESGAVRSKFIPDLARAIRFAHWRGIHVIVRIPCFHDPWADKHLPDKRLSMRFAPIDKPIHMDWIDPTNPEAQEYVRELTREAIDAGADEIQLDYVRFPVHVSQKTVKLPDPNKRSHIIRDFVKSVRAITKEAGIHLSLDFFGVAATGIQYDIDRLGQDIATVAPEADAISLMAYASHYGKGYMGWTEPADHPEIIAIANKAGIAKLKPTGAKTIFRTWLQAFPQRVTNYGPKYVFAQAKHAEESGGVGWLMWSPGCEYSAVWGAWPVINKKKPAAKN